MNEIKKLNDLVKNYYLKLGPISDKIEFNESILPNKKAVATPGKEDVLEDMAEGIYYIYKSQAILKEFDSIYNTFVDESFQLCSTIIKTYDDAVMKEIDSKYKEFKNMPINKDDNSHYVRQKVNFLLDFYQTFITQVHTKESFDKCLEESPMIKILKDHLREEDLAQVTAKLWDKAVEKITEHMVNEYWRNISEKNRYDQILCAPRSPNFKAKYELAAEERKRIDYEKKIANLVDKNEFYRLLALNPLFTRYQKKSDYRGICTDIEKIIPKPGREMFTNSTFNKELMMAAACIESQKNFED